MVLNTALTGLSLLYLSKTRLSRFKQLSGRWESLNHILTPYGPHWDNVDFVRYTAFSDNVDNASPSWTDVYNAKPQLNSFLTTLSTNSASWDLDVIDGIPIYNLTHPKSQDWNNVYTLLSGNSGNWESAITSFDILSSDLNIQTPIYNNLSQKVNENKDTLWVTSELNDISANYFNFWDEILTNIKTTYWDNAKSDLDSLSSNLNIYTNIFDNLYSLISSNSATNWDNTILNTISSNYFGLWDSFYTTISTYKDKWNSINSGVTSLSTSIDEKIPDYDSLYETVTQNAVNIWSSINVSYLNKYDFLYSSLTSSSASWMVSDIFSNKFEKYDDFYQTASQNINYKWYPNEWITVT